MIAHLAPGLYENMDVAAYFADPCPTPSLNQSLIPALVECSPRHAAFEHPRLNPYGPPDIGGKAQFLGSAVHRLALGRGAEISTIRYPDYTSTSAREARDLACANGRIPILERDLVKARDLAAIVKAQIEDVLEGAPYQTEVAMFWRETTRHGVIWCRGMLDVWCEARMAALDVKCLRIRATPSAFSRAAGQSGYDVQQVHYQRGLAQVVGTTDFAFLVVENTPPHGARPFRLDGPSLAAAEAAVAQSYEIWAQCLAERSWPSYPRGVADVSTSSFHQRAFLETS
jgi:hypothetical protein